MKIRVRYIWISLISLLVVIFTYFIYEIYLKEVIWRKKFFDIAFSLSDNYEENRNEFMELLEFSKKVEPIDMIYFYDNDIVKINGTHIGNKQSDFSISFYKKDDYNSISYTGDPITEIETSLFKQNSEINLSLLLDTIWNKINWTYSFEGKRSDEDFSSYLYKKKWNQDQLDSLEIMLQKVNCFSFEKRNSDLLILKHWGGWVESFDYIITNSESIDTGILNEYLYWGEIHRYEKPYFFWAYFKHGLICIESFIN